MRSPNYFLFFFMLLVLSTACQSEKTLGSSTDPHSYAGRSEARITHMDLNCVVDFEAEILTGSVVYKISRTKQDQEIWFDSHDLTIDAVFVSPDGSDETKTPYKLGPEDEILGQALQVALPDSMEYVHILYSTQPGAEALQFLPKELTTDQRAPFLLTQSQAINARTWVPIQDSPGIRFTYRATIKVPEGLMAVMSAESPQVRNEYGVYEFEMKQKIPAYLLALAVGDFSFRAIGPRSGVYAEPSVLDTAAYEFADLPRMIEIAESLYGPYRWGRYDVIVLPSSFPFGGMENPRMTFVTPTVLAGDRSLVSLLAHELAHSWSGNLVTNATWNDFWLNEGFTVYFENRIMERLKGKEYAEMLAQIGYQDLVDEVPVMMPNDSRDTWLLQDLGGRNPDDGMTSIAYEKGFYFLKLIEKTVGRKAFDGFLKSYFSDFAFQSMTTDRFLEILDKKLLKNYSGSKEKIRIDDWVYGVGVPDNVPFTPSVKFEKVEETVNSWIAGVAVEMLETQGWSTHEWLHFIRNLPESITPAHMQKLDAVFNLSESQNAEIQALWYRKAILADYEAAYPAMKSFLIQVGRRKFLMPLYSAMIENGRETELAHEIYKEARSRYHPISVTSVDQLLHWTEEES